MTVQQENRRQRTLEILSRMRKLENQDEAVIEQVAAAKLALLLEHAKSSAWWREHLGGGLSAIDKSSAQATLMSLPLLSRDKLQKNLNWMRIWISGSHFEGYAQTSTSGSTAEPVKVMRYTPHYTPSYAAYELLDTQWSERDLNKNIGFYRITQPKTLKGPMTEPLSYFEATGSIIYRSVIELTPSQLLETIATEQVAYLSVNAMVQRLLALEQLERPVEGVKLEQFMSWADPVTLELRDLVSEAFGARIIDRYSSNEFGYLALQCPKHDHLHAPQIHNYIEILDEFNQPVARGELGRVVVTSLENLAQPMIRYELGDMARWGEACEAGITFPVIEPGIVRQREVRTDAAGRILVPYPDGLGLVKSGAIRRYQILEFQDLLVFLVEIAKPISDFEIQETEEKLSKQFGNSAPAKIVQMPAEKAPLLSPWKNKLVVTVNSPAPEVLNPEDLMALLPNYPAKAIS